MQWQSWISKFRTHAKNRCVNHFLCNYSEVNVTRSQWWVINIDSANGLLPTGRSRNMLSFDFCSCCCVPEQAVELIITLTCIWYAMALLWCHRNVPSMPYQRQRASVYIKLDTLWPICDKEPCHFSRKATIYIDTLTHQYIHKLLINEHACEYPYLLYTLVYTCRYSPIIILNPQLYPWMIWIMLTREYDDSTYRAMHTYCILLILLW